VDGGALHQLSRRFAGKTLMSGCYPRCSASNGASPLNPVRGANVGSRGRAEQIIAEIPPQVTAYARAVPPAWSVAVSVPAC
jgi:hypothetical protein